MSTLLKALALTVAWLVSSVALAGEAVPVNATFGIQWTPVNWGQEGQEDPPVRETYTFGAAGLPNGQVIGNYSYTWLNPEAGTIEGFVVLYFSYSDGVVLKLSGAAGFDPLSGTASFSGPMVVDGGWGRFLNSTGTLTMKSKILFGPYVGTYQIKGVIKTAK